MDILREKGIKFMEPFLPIASKKRMRQRLIEAFASENIPEKELTDAMNAAYDELEHYREDVRKKGAEILAYAKEHKMQVILLVGRPYHIDPEINHGIPEMIQSYNLAIVSEDSVYHMPVQEDNLYIVNQWSYHARLYHAAEFAAAQAHNRLYTMIKLDEVTNLGAARIRLRSLLAVLSRRPVPKFEPLVLPDRPHFTPECKATHTILAPQMAPIHFELIKHVLTRYGYNLVIPETNKNDAINAGLQYVHNDMCYPAIVVIGQMLAALKSGKYDPDHTSIVLFCAAP